MWQGPVSCLPAYKRGTGLQRGMGKAKYDRQDRLQTKMRLIIMPLMVVPMLTLAIVGFLAASSSLA